MLGWIWCSDTLFRKLVPGEDPNAGGQRGSGSRRVRHQKIEKIQNQQMWGSRGGNSMEIHRVDLEVANSMEISKCVHI